MLASATPLTEISTVLLLLALVSLLAIAAKNWTVPYPTLLVLAGACLALVPGLPDVQLTPDVVFLLFLPPLLYYAAWQTNLRDFRQEIRPIGFLAFGLVLATTLVIGCVCKWYVPEMPWAAAFALGAIISPPDAIAATAVTQKLGVPKRVITILEGESLLNDAAGLVAYRVALAVAAGELFTISGTAFHFLYVAVGGIAVGIVVGYLAINVHRRLDDPVIETVLSVLMPYAAYIVCEELAVSGVLACVCLGWLKRAYATEVYSATTRLHTVAVWQSIVFVLTGLTFIFIGLGLRSVVISIADEASLELSIQLTLLVLICTIALRLLWVFPMAWLPAYLIPSSRKNGEYPSNRLLILIGWTGMRGVVSLACALALPSDFPFRNTIFFTVFGVIFGTLVIQGLSLPYLVKALKIQQQGRSTSAQEMDARLAMLAEGNLFLQQQIASGSPESEMQYIQSRMTRQADIWLSTLHSQLGQVGDEVSIEHQPSRIQNTYLALLKKQRLKLHQLVSQGIIDEATANKLHRELDMDESRLLSITGASAADSATNVVANVVASTVENKAK